jgi:hypothetical protein
MLQRCNDRSAAGRPFFSLKGWNNKAQGNAGVALGFIVPAFQAEERGTAQIK